MKNLNYKLIIITLVLILSGCHDKYLGDIQENDSGTVSDNNVNLITENTDADSSEIHDADSSAEEQNLSETNELITHELDKDIQAKELTIELLSVEPISDEFSKRFQSPFDDKSVLVKVLKNEYGKLLELVYTVDNTELSLLFDFGVFDVGQIPVTWLDMDHVIIEGRYVYDFINETVVDLFDIVGLDVDEPFMRDILLSYCFSHDKNNMYWSINGETVEIIKFDLTQKDYNYEITYASEYAHAYTGTNSIRYIDENILAIQESFFILNEEERKYEQNDRLGIINIENHDSHYIYTRSPNSRLFYYLINYNQRNGIINIVEENRFESINILEYDVMKEEVINRIDIDSEYFYAANDDIIIYSYNGVVYFVNEDTKDVVYELDVEGEDSRYAFFDGDNITIITDKNIYDLTVVE